MVLFLRAALRPAGDSGAAGARGSGLHRLFRRAGEPLGGGLHPSGCGPGPVPGADAHPLRLGGSHDPGGLCGGPVPPVRLGDGNTGGRVLYGQPGQECLVLQRGGDRLCQRGHHPADGYVPPPGAHHPGGAGGHAGAGYGLRHHRRFGPGPAHALPRCDHQRGLYRHGP